MAAAPSSSMSNSHPVVQIHHGQLAAEAAEQSPEPQESSDLHVVAECSGLHVAAVSSAPGSQ